MQILKNATIMPLAGTMDKHTGGIFRSPEDFIDDSITCRGIKPEWEPPREMLEGVFIYGGSLFGHYGHFIWESLSRLAAVRKCNSAYPILFISPNEEIYNMQLMFFKAIGVRNNIKIIKIPTQCENIIYDAPQSSLSPLFISDEQIRALEYFNFGENGKDKFKKIWLSRSALPGDKFRKVVNEVEIEQILRDRGFNIIHPEKLPLMEQARIVNRADIVAGFDGSQFFSVLFSKDIRGRFLIFNSRPRIARTLPYIFQRKGIEYALNTFKVKDVGNEEWKISHKYFAEDADKIIDILSEA